MSFLNVYFLILLSIIPLLGCQKFNKSSKDIDNKSYINDFELLREDPSKNNSIRIIAPKAVIDPINNNIEIYKSSIELLDKNGQDFIVRSGNSNLNNKSGSIEVYNNVNISFLDNEDYFITTNSFNWDLNKSIIDIDNQLNINLDNTMILASNGYYNIVSGLLKIDNPKLNRNIYNSDGKVKYQVEINSNSAKWFKEDNSLEFSSNNKQVETTINFLTTK